MNVVLRKSGSVVEIAMDGEVDLASNEGLTNVIVGLDDLLRVDGVDTESVVIDMSEVSFCDGSGIAFLVGMQAKSKDAGAGFAVHEPSPIVRRLLGILELEAMLDERAS